MKYLEQKDKAMCDKAKMVIRDCAKKNKQGDPAYTSLSASMQIHLKRLVGSLYWKKAEDYLSQFLKQQFMKKQPGLTDGEAHLKASAMAREAAAPLLPSSSSVGSVGVTKTQSQSSSLLNPVQQEAARQRQLHEAQQARMNQMELKRKEQLKKLHNKKREDLRKKAEAQHQQQALVLHRQQQQQQEPGRSPTVIPPPSKKGGGKKADPRSKQQSLPGNNVLMAPAKAVVGVNSVPLKEYSELMSTLDHATELDVNSVVLISGRGGAAAGILNLEEEQRQLLYGTNGERKKSAKGLYGSGIPVVPTSGGSSTLVDKDGGTSTEEVISKLPSHLRGWSERNLVSSRTAWAKLRLVEREEAKRQEIHLPTPESSHLEEGKEILELTPSSVEKPMPASFCNSEWNWYNENTAEEDQALALISEATQLYVKTLLEGSINMSRQRMNVDGIRLWHIQQSAAAMNGMGASAPNGPLGLSQASHRPPLSLRLGCDVSRQHALAQGNAAKVCQRMEEALLRKRNIVNERCGLEDSFTLSEADGMDAVSKIPKLKTAASKADYNAKRSFEVYGGKDSGNPPLGRVPKQARILKNDFQACMRDPAFALYRGGITTRSFA